MVLSCALQINLDLCLDQVSVLCDATIIDHNVAYLVDDESSRTDQKQKEDKD